MAQGGGGKRKRGDRMYSQDSSNDGSRPSPHRPGNLNLAQQGHQPYPQQHQQQHGQSRDQQDYRGRGGRRGSRGGRGGGPPRSPMESPNARQVQSRQNTSSNQAMSPPPVPLQHSNENKTATIPSASPPTKPTSKQPTESPQAPLAPYKYEYVTSDRVTSWQQEGRRAVVDAGTQAVKEQDQITLCSIFQEVIRSGLDRRIDPPDAGLVVQEVIGEDSSSDSSPDTHSLNTTSLFLDCLSIVTDADPKTPSLRPMVLSTGISPLLMRQELESTLLETLGLIRSTFVRVGIRQQTNLLYRQSNYNLLREETEGYSKLITELFTTSSNEPPTSEVVEDTFERVKGMIGAFDLDVGRVLDVTLDVFAAVLVKQYRFFVRYLRASSWWPHEPSPSGQSEWDACLPKWALPGSATWTTSGEEKDELAATRDNRDACFWDRVREVGMKAFFEIGGRRVDEAVLEAAKDWDNENEGRQWIEATNTLPPQGNKVAAQILGFKLRFYSSSARDPNDVLPVNLIYLAALLIKIGFISLRDLYPHLCPADESMEAVLTEKMKEKAEREKLNRPGGGSMNALMTAGALTDDTLPNAGRLRETVANRATPVREELKTEKIASTEQVDAKEQLPEPIDQKVQLLKSLLCIGAIPESLFILGRFPWLPDAFPDLPEYIHRILNHCLSKIYEPLRPLNDRKDIQVQQKVSDVDQSGTPKGQVRLVDAPPRKLLRWAQLDKDDTNEGTDYRFYWDDWSDNVPVCQCVDDVFSLCGTLMNYSGVKIGQHPALLLKLARIGRHSLAEDPSERNFTRWIDLSKRLLVPALSLTKCNTGVVNEVYDLIKSFSTATRYNIYAEWYTGTISRSPDIKAAFDLARAETKDVLKRISLTNIKPMARALAKVAYACPGVVFAVAIGQIESYDNLVEVVVECARYFTFLGYDVLTWSLMSSLGARGRNRVQADGMLTSKWLAALSLFAGKVFKRYSFMSPTPILQYVAEQLRRSNPTDLIVLEQITSSMAGIVSDTNFNESQVISMAGGDLLQAQTMLQLLDTRHESRITARRLIKSLVEPKLVGQLLVSIAQERQTCIFKIPESDAHLKLLGNLFDEINRVLTQFLDFVRSNLSTKEFDSLIPGVSRLIGDFGLEPSIAFWISRPSIVAAIVEHDKNVVDQNAEQRFSSPKVATDKNDKADIEMGQQPENNKGTPTPKISNESDDSSPEANRVVEEVRHDSGVKDTTPPSSPLLQSPDMKQNGIEGPWHPVLQGLLDEARPSLPAQIWDTLGGPFYMTFWQLSLGDMLVPSHSYEDEINRQKRKILAISNDRSDLSISGTKQKEKDKKVLNDLSDRLRKEHKDQVQAYQQTRSRLQKEKEYWFANLWGKWDTLNLSLIEYCFYPRMVLSPVDAVYSFKMLKFLHSSGATNFRTMGVLDQLFNEKRLTAMVFLSTAKEAENIGRFFHEVLKDLSRWHVDKVVFEKEAYGLKKDLPGFCKKMTNPKTILAFWTYEDFRRVLLKWHRNLNTALKTCLSGGEYMHIRNAIIMLKAIHQQFPVINWMGQIQMASITELSRSEQREDLKIAATSLLGSLKRREKNWMLPQAFNLSESVANGANGTRSSSTKPRTPQPESEGSKSLNAQAPEFIPESPTETNGVPKAAKAQGRLDVEDGEIEDAKVANSVKLQSSAEVFRNTKPGHDDQPAAVSAPAPNSEVAMSIPPVTQENGKLDSSEESRLASARERTPQPQVLEKDAVSTPEVLIAHPSVPPKPDFDVSSYNAGQRAQHSLPSRPEPPPLRLTEHRLPERQGDRNAHVHARDQRFPPSSRSDRPGESQRDRISERGLPAPYPRGSERPVEKAHISGRDRIDQRWAGEKSVQNSAASDDRFDRPLSRDQLPPLRDERSERPSRERAYPDPHDARPVDPSSHLRNSIMAPPRTNIPHHPERAALIHGSQDIDRTFQGGQPDRRHESLKYDSHPSSGRSSRAASPTRRDDHRSLRPDGRREDRPPFDKRKISEESYHSHPARYEPSRPPTAPRVDRSNELGPSSRNDRHRDSLDEESASARSNDLIHGRLNTEPTDSSRARESQYGRLNSASDIPSGPRFPNRAQTPPNRGARNASAPQPQINTQLAQQVSQNPMPSPTVSDRQTPTGPSSTRAIQRGTSQLARPPSSALSAPPTPATESPDVAGIHPDRLKAIQGPGPNLPLTQTHNSSGAARGPNQTMPPSPTTAPPVGPRAPNTQPLSPVGPPTRGPPTGPSLGNDRNRGDKRRFAGLQNTLQQAGSPNLPERSNQGTTIRGRGGRANNASATSPVTSDAMTPSSFGLNMEPFGGPVNGSHAPAHAEDDMSYGRGARRDSFRDGGRDGDRRSGRRRNSRSHSRDRHAGPPLSQMPRDEIRMSRRVEEHRDRGRGFTGVGGDERRMGREEGKERDRRVEGSRRDAEEWAGERRDGMGRRDDRERERRDGMAGRKRGRGGDEGLSERMASDGKRSRRGP